MELMAGCVVGFLGSLHCVGMCGPLALALPVPPGPTGMYVFGRVLYNAGRTVTYAVLGLAAGVVGKLISLAGWQQGMSFTLGGLLLLSVLAPSALSMLSSRFTPAAMVTGRVRDALTRLFRRRSTTLLFLIGLLNGLLPCGFVTVGLAAAAATGGPVSAALFMAGFGIGTMPVMFGVALAGRRIHPPLRRRIGFLAPVLTVAVALVIIVRGMNLGIPYLSPHLARPGAPVPSCCSGEGEEGR